MTEEQREEQRQEEQEQRQRRENMQRRSEGQMGAGFQVIRTGGEEDAPAERERSGE